MYLIHNWYTHCNEWETYPTKDTLLSIEIRRMFWCLNSFAGHSVTIFLQVPRRQKSGISSMIKAEIYFSYLLPH